MKPFLLENKNRWDSLVPAHLDSDFYAVDDFKSGECSLKEIEIQALGDVSGKSLLHLQCHFGLDSLSWARKGAQVTGVDFSGEAVRTARALATELNLENANFIQSDILNLASQDLPQFDIVFTSYGVLGWLPDLNAWAETVDRHLKPGGTFLVVEFHPALMMLNFETGEFGYDYFHRHYADTLAGSYASSSEEELAEHTWSHSLADIVTSLLKTGLLLQDLQEFDYSPYGCFSNMSEEEPGRWRYPTGVRFPHVFSLQFVRSKR